MTSRKIFFESKEQSEFIHRVYQETPETIRNLFQKELIWLSESLQDCNQVLEIGCGTGRAFKTLSRPIHYIGIDIGFSYLREAISESSSAFWICGDALRLPFQDSSIQCLFCIQNTIGNMEGIEQQVLAEMRRVLEPGGKLILSCYSEDSYEIRKPWYQRLIDCKIFGRIWTDLQNPRITRSDTGWSSRCFSKEELLQMFSLAGFEVTIRKLDSFLYFCETISGE